MLFINYDQQDWESLFFKCATIRQSEKKAFALQGRPVTWVSNEHRYLHPMGDQFFLIKVS